MSGWIPVTRELPEVGRQVLASCRYKDAPVIACRETCSSISPLPEVYTLWVEPVSGMVIDVVAWMELPEPYKPRCWDCVHCALGGDVLVCTNLDSDEVGETWADNSCERWNDHGKG